MDTAPAYLFREVLPLDRERRLFGLLKRCKKGSRRWTCLRNAIVLGHLRLVSAVSATFTNERFSADDLFSDGVLISFGCIERYDPTRGAKFSTYLCASLRWRLWQRINKPVKLAERVQTSEDGIVERTAPTSTMETVLRREDVRRAHDLISTLRPRYAEIVREYFIDAKPLSAVGAVRGVTGERVRQITARSFSQLREPPAVPAVAKIPIQIPSKQARPKRESRQRQLLNRCAAIRAQLGAAR